MAPHTDQGLAEVFGQRQDTGFVARKALLEPCGITRSCTDGWGAYERQVEAEPPTLGQANTQKSESKPINVRTRLKRWVRRARCFAKAERMHDLVIGLFINRYEFGRPIYHGINSSATPSPALCVTLSIVWGLHYFW